MHVLVFTGAHCTAAVEVDLWSRIFLFQELNKNFGSLLCSSCQFWGTLGSFCWAIGTVCPAGWRMRWVSWQLQKLLPVGNPWFSASVQPSSSSSSRISIRISAAHLVVQLDADGQCEHPLLLGVSHLRNAVGEEDRLKLGSLWQIKLV